jgi:hypothetical protein
MDQPAQLAPASHRCTKQTFAIDPAHAIYIDDRTANVDVAASFSMHGSLFTDLRSLRAELMREGFLLG